MRPPIVISLCVAFAIAFGAPEPRANQSASDQRPEATSLLGKPLFSPPPSPTAAPKLQADLAAAEEALKRAPNDPDAIIWVGRRLAYLGRYGDALRMFTDGMYRFPKDARFPRHRGHRYITLRQLDRAIADLEKAAELIQGQPDQVEPDGQPNAKNIPLTTLHSNVRYHLGLAYYLKGDFVKAAPVWEQARAAVNNGDNIVSASHWLYLTLRRIGRNADAQRVLDQIPANIQIIENTSYRLLLRLYQGISTADETLRAAGEGAAAAAVEYGVSGWHYVHGRIGEATIIWRALAASPEWAPFGVIAAEAELARLKRRPVE